MAVGYGLEDFPAKPFPEFHHPLLMARWAEMAPLARKCQQKFMAAVFTFDPCKAVMEDAAVQKAINHLFHIGPEKPVSGCKPLVPAAAGLQGLKVILNALIVLRLLWSARPVNRGCAGQFPSPGKRFKTNPTRNTVRLTESQGPRAEGIAEARILQSLFFRRQGKGYAIQFALSVSECGCLDLLI
jgi:hypothetical protein